MTKKPLQELSNLGQSVWLDYISRPLIETGKLQELIDQGLRGMTSNPSIFNQSIGTTKDYDEKISQLKKQSKTTFEIYDELTIKDIQDATDIFKSVYTKTHGLDGYVSLEINPLLANKIEDQIKEGIRLYRKVNRPNVMIKVPSTKEGIPVVEELIAQGINVNVTLIFSLNQYEQTAQSYIRGLKRLSNKTNDLSKVHSVASVFVSRIDSAIDKTLDEMIANEKVETKKTKLKYLKGRAAVSNSRVIFEKSKEIFSNEDFKTLSKKNANLQRVLWASTGTKNSDYSDIKYVTELISTPTVNTIPEATLNAFIDHGITNDAFNNSPQSYFQNLSDLKSFGIDIDQVNSKLLDEGCSAFNKAFESLLLSIEKKADSLVLNA